MHNSGTFYMCFKACILIDDLSDLFLLCQGCVAIVKGLAWRVLQIFGLETRHCLLHQDSPPELTLQWQNCQLTRLVLGLLDRL